MEERGLFIAQKSPSTEKPRRRQQLIQRPNAADDSDSKTKMLSHGTHCAWDASIHARFQHAHRKLNRRLPHATAAIIMTCHEDVTVHWQSIPDSHQAEASLS